MVIVRIMDNVHAMIHSMEQTAQFSFYHFKLALLLINKLKEISGSISSFHIFGLAAANISTLVQKCIQIYISSLMDIKSLLGLTMIC